MKQWQICLFLAEKRLIKLELLKSSDRSDSVESKWIQPYYDCKVFPEKELPHRLSRFVNDDTIRTTMKKLFKVHSSDGNVLNQAIKR